MKLANSRHACHSRWSVSACQAGARRWCQCCDPCPDRQQVLPFCTRIHSQIARQWKLDDGWTIHHCFWCMHRSQPNFSHDHTGSADHKQRRPSVPTTTALMKTHSTGKGISQCTAAKFLLRSLCALCPLFEQCSISVQRIPNTEVT